jgi:hypothetical protein
LWYAPFLAEGVDIYATAGLILRIPDGRAEFEPQFENAVLEFAGRNSIIVRRGSRQR